MLEQLVAALGPTDDATREEAVNTVVEWWSFSIHATPNAKQLLI